MTGQGRKILGRIQLTRRQRHLSLILGAAFIGVVALSLALAPEAVAGVGGVFVKAVKASFLLRTLLVVAAIILLPLILFVFVRENIAVRRTKRDLAALATKFPAFDWPSLAARIRESVISIYDVWQSGDLSPVADYMTADYYQSQQDMLDRWKAEGKRNVLSLKSGVKVKPLTVDVGDDEILPAVWVSISVDVIDYLEDLGTGRRIKGRKKKKDGFETVWMFAYDRGAWRVGSVSDGADSLTVAMQRNDVDTTFLDHLVARPVPSAVPASEAESEDESGSGTG